MILRAASVRCRVMALIPPLLIFGAQFDFESVHKLFLVGQIHKPIAGGGGSHVGALQPGKVDNQSVVALPPIVLRWIERRPSTVGGYPGAYLRSLG